MWTEPESSPSSRSELEASHFWCPSAILALGYPHSRWSRSLMHSSPPNLTAPAWDFGSAAPLPNRMAAACGLLTTLRAVRAFTSPYLPKSRLMNDTDRRSHGLRH